MNIKSAMYKGTACWFLMMLLNACVTMPTFTTKEIANQFAKAINKNDVQALITLSDIPFHIHNHEWETANDGYGFVLGKRDRRIFEKNEELSAYLRNLVEKLKVDSVDGEYIPLEEYSRFHDEFGSYAKQWESQDAYLFLRGIGDVEHIMILGVSRETKKIEQIYFN
jgi:hypothetical protein